jgi:hypothetical protein
VVALVQVFIRVARTTGKCSVEPVTRGQYPTSRSGISRTGLGS